MVTRIDTAKREHVGTTGQDERAWIAQARAQGPTGLADAIIATHAQPVTTTVAIDKTSAGFNPMDFVRDNRIQVKHGSLFVDPYLVLHPRELAPENEAKLRDKLRLTYTVNNPSFYESYDRVAIALNLGQLVPTSLEAKRSKLMEEVKKFNTQVEAGVDAELAKHDTDKRHPFAAIVRDTIEKPAKDPVGIETLKNGLAVYLLIREKLTAQGYLNKLSDYVTRAGTPDQVLGDLADKIGISPLQLREAALKGGVDGVGKLLGLDPAYVNDVKKITDYAATQDFGFNIIEHWHLGRQLLGVQAPMEQKIAHGLEARITGKIAEFRGRVRHHYDVPEPIKTEEKRIAEALHLVEPIQRALMHKLGYEICFTPEYLADDIAMYRGIYGLHRKAASDLRDTRATYRVYFSGRGDLKGSMRTLVHEVAHNLWPEQFTPEETKKIDALAASDAKRFAAFSRMMDEKFPEFEKFLRAYQVGSDAEKAAIVQTTKAYFSGYGVSIDEGLLPYLRDANDFRFLVKHAVDTLSVEGARYAKSGYDSPHERFREVLSRFAELKQVELKGEPQLMQFLAPGLNQVWENHYIPHLKRVYQKVVATEQTANEAITKAKSVDPVPIREEAGLAVPEAPASPKVEQRPTPTKAGADACTAHATPDTRVEASSIELNPQTLAALDTLKSMGVHAVR